MRMWFTQCCVEHDHTVLATHHPAISFSLITLYINKTCFVLFVFFSRCTALFFLNDKVLSGKTWCSFGVLLNMHCSDESFANESALRVGSFR